MPCLHGISSIRDWLYCRLYSTLVEQAAGLDKSQGEGKEKSVTGEEVAIETCPILDKPMLIRRCSVCNNDGTDIAVLSGAHMLSLACWLHQPHQLYHVEWALS